MAQRKTVLQRLHSGLNPKQTSENLHRARIPAPYSFSNQFFFKGVSPLLLHCKEMGSSLSHFLC